MSSGKNIDNNVYIERLLNDVLGELSFHGETYADQEVLERLDVYQFALNHIYQQMEGLLGSTFNKKEFSAISLFNKTHHILKEHKENVSIVRWVF